jgi:hypothetical protein
MSIGVKLLEKWNIRFIFSAAFHTFTPSLPISLSVYEISISKCNTQWELRVMYRFPSTINPHPVYTIPFMSHVLSNDTSWPQFNAICIEKRAINSQWQNAYTHHVYANTLRGPFVSKRTITTVRPPLVGEVSGEFYGWKGVAWSAQLVPRAISFGFSRPESLIFFQVVLQ